jgi:hypothetical protein
MFYGRMLYQRYGLIFLVSLVQLTGGSASAPTSTSTSSSCPSISFTNSLKLELHFGYLLTMLFLSIHLHFSVWFYTTNVTKRIPYIYISSRRKTLLSFLFG